MYAVLDDFFAVLGNKQRVRILQHLEQDGGKCVGQIADRLKLEQSAVSHNIKRLHDCHFVEVEHHGKERVYTINEDTVRPLFQLINKHVSTYCVKGCTHWK